jgi:hypothetical protein
MGFCGNIGFKTFIYTIREAKLPLGMVAFMLCCFIGVPAIIPSDAGQLRPDGCIDFRGFYIIRSLLYKMPLTNPTAIGEIQLPHFFLHLYLCYRVFVACKHITAKQIAAIISFNRL